MTIRLLPGRAPARALWPIVRTLAALGVTPAMLTLAGFAGNVAAAGLVATGWLLPGGIVMLLASAIDMLDGALARATGRAGPGGALLDSVLDRFSESVVLFGLLVYGLERDQRDVAMLAFAAVVGSLMVSYVRARAEGLDIDLTEGLFRRQERVVLTAAGLIFGLVLLMLWVLAVLSLLTAVQRFFLARREIRRQDAARERAHNERAEGGRAGKGESG